MKGIVEILYSATYLGSAAFRSRNAADPLAHKTSWLSQSNRSDHDRHFFWIMTLVLCRYLNEGIWGSKEFKL